jgi:hypothetical protein
VGSTARGLLSQGKRAGKKYIQCARMAVIVAVHGFGNLNALWLLGGCEQMVQ